MDWFIKFSRDSCLFLFEVFINGRGWGVIVGDVVKGIRNKRSCV